MSELRLPTDLRTEADVSNEIRRRTANAARALLAAFEAAVQTEDVDERCLRLADVGFVAARGHDELRALYLRISGEWGEHSDLEELALALGLFAAANACAAFGGGIRHVLDPDGPGYIEQRASYEIGLEWAVRLIVRSTTDIGDEDE